MTGAVCGWTACKLHWRSGLWSTLWSCVCEHATLPRKAIAYCSICSEEFSVKKSSLFEFECILYESTNWGYYFYVSHRRLDRHFTCSSESREGLAICQAKAVPSFFSCFKTLSIGPAQGIEPATSYSAVKRSTDWANPARRQNINKNISFLSFVACFQSSLAS